MALNPKQRAFAPPISAAGLTRFPSQVLWEDPWEPELDLYKLRAKADHIALLEQLASDPSHDEPLPRRNDDDIAPLVDGINLPSEAASQLRQDAQLIARWYFVPALQERIGMGTKPLLAALRRAATQSAPLSNELATFGREIQAWLEALPEEATGSELDVITLANDLARFTRRANKVLALQSKGGRRHDRRRNIALVLITQAAEEASREQVKTSRGTKSTPGSHFPNHTGQFVRGFMRLLGHIDEQSLVGAFERLRRRPSVNQSRPIDP